MRKFTLILSLCVFAFSGFAQRAATKADTKFTFELPKTVKGEADVTDTLVPASFNTGTPTIYTASSGGYVCGANGYGDLGKAQHFNSGSETYLVQGVMLWVGANELKEDSLKFAVYGFDGEPTTVLSSMNVAFSQVTTTVEQVSGTTDFFYSVMFDSPVEVTGEFAVGVEFTVTDGFGLVSTSAGDGGVDAWEIWSDGYWYDVYSSWGLDIDMGIFPLISKKVVADNLIIDGDFPTDGVLPVAPWAIWSGNGGVAEIIDGVCVMTPGGASDQWQLQVNQDSLTALNDSAYMLTFTAWADADRVFAIDFEDIPANGYNRYGDSYDADAVNGTSEWQVAITTVPTVYQRTVTYKRILENTVQKLNIMPSASIEKVYIDNISLVKIAPIPVQDVDVTFNIDLTAKIANGGFIVGTDVVYVTGSFNGWDQPGTGESVLMSDDNNDKIYTATVTMPGYTAGITYKYFKNASWDFGDQNGGDRPLATANIDITKNDTWDITGINDMDLNAITLTPNPFNGELVINNAEGASQIVVSNLLGQAVMTVNEITGRLVLSTEGLNKGVYFVTIIDNNNNRRTERVVKQ